MTQKDLGAQNKRFLREEDEVLSSDVHPCHHCPFIFCLLLHARSPSPPQPWGEGNRAPLLRLNKNRFAGHITPGSGKDLHYPFSQATSRCHAKKRAALHDLTHPQIGSEKKGVIDRRCRSQRLTRLCISQELGTGSPSAGLICVHNSGCSLNERQYDRAQSWNECLGSAWPSCFLVSPGERQAAAKNCQDGTLGPLSSPKLTCHGCGSPASHSENSACP